MNTEFKPYYHSNSVCSSAFKTGLISTCLEKYRSNCFILNSKYQIFKVSNH